MIQTAVRVVTIITMAFGLSAFAQQRLKPKAAAPAKQQQQTYSAPVHQYYNADFEYELQTMMSGGGLESKKIAGETTTQIGLQAAVTKVVRGNIQVGVEAEFYNESGRGGSSYFQALGLGVYNFDKNLKESLYGKVGLGMLNVINEKGKNEAKFAIMFGGGKKIPLMDKVAYTPEVRVIMVDGSTRFQILALNFSLFY